MFHLRFQWLWWTVAQHCHLVDISKTVFYKELYYAQIKRFLNGMETNQTVEAVIQEEQQNRLFS